MEKYKSILVPFNFEESSTIALTQSYNLARLSGLGITLLYVFEERGNLMTKLFGGEDRSEDMMKRIEEQLEEFAVNASKESGLKILPMVVKGKVYVKIVEMAEIFQSKFIVMSATSNLDYEGSSKRIVGPNTSRVVRAAKCPVLTINSLEHNNGCRSILLPLDLTQETRQKVTQAIELARLFGSTIKIISILWSVNHKVISTQLKQTVAQVEKFIEDHNVKCTAEILEANKESEEVPMMLEFAKAQGDIDLIMIMTQKETGWTEFFVDSQATDIIRLSDIPVMSIIPKDMGETVAR
jgi:nucleotide-binding universal stress UspA family protein